MSLRKLRSRSSYTSQSNASPSAKRQKTAKNCDFQRNNPVQTAPKVQKALLLHAIRTPYVVQVEFAVPEIQHDHELLVRVNATGLNPIDWKAPDYNFGIPILPYVSGRELVGTVVKTADANHSRIKEGDVVIIPSTDYRDVRKAAFQEYTIASKFNAIRLPAHITIDSGSVLGVAFVSAALALGVCMGISFEHVEAGPDFRRLIKDIKPGSLPSDIRQECLSGIGEAERARSGDWLVIWGGSSTCANVAKQLARLAGLKIISVVDGAKHGWRVSSTPAIRPDLLVDSHNPERAVAIIKAATGNRARSLLPSSVPESSLPTESKTQRRKDSKLPSPPATPLEHVPALLRSHIVGLAGLPKGEITEGMALHSVPIKLFHEIQEIGEALSAWCERLLVRRLLVPPDVVGRIDGLAGINEGLDRMRRREVSGGRLTAVIR